MYSFRQGSSRAAVEVHATGATSPRGPLGVTLPAAFAMRFKDEITFEALARVAHIPGDDLTSDDYFTDVERSSSGRFKR